MRLSDRCLDCPLAWGDALLLVAVSLALLFLGRILLGMPRRLQRGFGFLGLSGSLVLHAFGLATIALVGVGRGAAGRTTSRDAAFAAAWLALSVVAFALAVKVTRVFPLRASPLRAVSAPPEDDGIAREGGSR